MQFQTTHETPAAARAYTSLMKAMSAMFGVILCACGGATFEDERVQKPGTTGQDVVIDATATRLAAGAFEGRDGHHGTGTAELFQLASGDAALRFDRTFEVSSTPGLTVVLSNRDAIGTRIEADDVEIAPLRSRTGEQSYAIGADRGMRRVFIFCKSFGVEIAKATLKENE